MSPYSVRKSVNWSATDTVMTGSNDAAIYMLDDEQLAMKRLREQADEDTIVACWREVMARQTLSR